MTRKLKSIEPFSLAKLMGLGYAAMGLLFIPFMIIGPNLMALAPESAQEDVPKGLFVGLGVGFALAMPLLYGAMGFVFGLISGFVYNLLAKWVGGIEVEIE